MSSPGTFQQTWHDDQGRRLELCCIDDQCVIDIGTPHQPGLELQLELLQQSRDGRGLPCGMPVSLWKTSIWMVPCSRTKRLQGHCVLPQSIPPQTALNGFFRLSPCP
jgi:hypothetical protein